jgi:uncharacterized protein (TIGR03067 family)
MKRYLFGFVVFAAIAGAARSEATEDAAEKMLQGEWDLASVEVEGKRLPAPAGKGGSIVFAKDGKLIWKDPGKPEKIGTYKIDAGKQPKQIDLIASKDGATMRGIYELDSEKLQMAFSADGPKGKRPRDFKGDKVLIVIWKRQKP